MSITIKELKKNYGLSEEQMRQVRDAMEIAQKSIDVDAPGRRSRFENRLVKIVGAKEGNYFVGEEFAEAYFLERKWVDVFLDFYGDELKFRDTVEKWKKGEI